MTDIRERAAVAAKELRETDEAFRVLRQAMVEALTGLTPSDTANMQALVCAIQALDGVKKALQAVVDTGRLEDAAEEMRAALRLS